MDDMKKGVLTKALGMLTVCGCKFVVIDPDGNKYGTLEVAKEEEKYTRPKLLQIFKEQIDNIKEPSGTEHEFTVPPEVDPQSYRGAICGYCTRSWGRETYSSQLKGDKVIILRYA